MTREETIELLEEVKTIDDSMFQFIPKYMDALDMAINALQMEPCEDCISFPKGALKMRGKGYVVYNYDWLKENWQIELKILGIDWRKQMQEPILDKIRAEIMSKDGLEEALEIIDKYKAESEG